MRNKLLIALVLFLALFGSTRLYYTLTDDFKISNISDSLPYNPEWETAYSAEEEKALRDAVDQPYYYIGKGAQVYAFASRDGKYVLKFFKFKHLRPSLFITLLPPIGPLRDFKQQNMKRKERKLFGVFEGHRIAHAYDRENSGLLYIHLNLTQNLQLKAHLFDKIGREHVVDLDRTVFVLQRKGETLRDALARHLDRQEVSEAARKAGLILRMYREEYNLGVYDRDHGISHNTGFVGDAPFHLDVGKFSYDPKMASPEVHKEDLAHVAYKIREWVRLNYPALSEAFNAQFSMSESQ